MQQETRISCRTLVEQSRVVSFAARGMRHRASRSREETNGANRLDGGSEWGRDRKNRVGHAKRYLICFVGCCALYYPIRREWAARFMRGEIISKIKAGSQITAGISWGGLASVWRTDRIYHPSTYLTVATGVAPGVAPGAWFLGRKWDLGCCYAT